ncbi:MAG: hypothetical protein AAF797_17655 [Planctomycetota bacterium]
MNLANPYKEQPGVAWLITLATLVMTAVSGGAITLTSGVSETRTREIVIEELADRDLIESLRQDSKDKDDRLAHSETLRAIEAVKAELKHLKQEIEERSSFRFFRWEFVEYMPDFVIWLKQQLREHGIVLDDRYPRISTEPPKR